MLKRRQALLSLTGASLLVLTNRSAATSPYASSLEGVGPQLPGFWSRPRRIRMSHASGELLDITYWSDGQIHGDAWRNVSHFMRDRVVSRGVYMSPKLLDVLYGISAWLEYFNVSSCPVLHSGYRDPDRNLRIEGAALNSKHITGEAADISIPGVSSLQISRFGQWLGGGGVGWYPQKNFVHLDVGSVRTWRS